MPFRKGRVVRRRTDKRNAEGKFTIGEEGRRIATALVTRPGFVTALEAQLDKGCAHPSIVNTLLYYAYGKPKETIETQQLVPVKIEHVYTTDPPDEKTPRKPKP